MKVKVGDTVVTGQHLSGVGKQGTVNGYHLHVALSNVVGKLPEEGGNPVVPFTTIPAQFSDYEVLNEATQIWEQVDVGNPQRGQILRNPRHWSGWRSELGVGTFPFRPGSGDLRRQLYSCIRAGRRSSHLA